MCDQPGKSALSDGGQKTVSLDPDKMEARDYLRKIEGGEIAVHVYMKDDKELWLAHNPEKDYPGSLNGPWLFWSTYPSGPWQLLPMTRQIMHHNVDELYYIDYDGDEAHTVHEVTAYRIEDAPEFVRGEFDDDE